MKTITRGHTRGARMARAHTEHLTNTELFEVPSIVWSLDDYHEARHAVNEAMDMSPEERDAWIRDQLGPGKDPEDYVATQMPFFYLYLSVWFGDRYRAHAPLIGQYHLNRFLAIQSFVANQREKMAADGWSVGVDGGFQIEDAMVEALIAIFYDDSEEPAMEKAERFGAPVFEYDDVSELARAIADGEVTVAEFEYTPYTGPGSEVYQVDYEDESRPIPMDLLQRGLRQHTQVVEMGAAERGVYERRAREAVPELFANDMPYENVALVMWLVQAEGVEPEDAIRYGNKILTAAKFLDEYMDDLENDGYARIYDNGLEIQPAVLKAIALSRIEVPLGARELPLLRYESITSVADTLMEMSRRRGEDGGEAWAGEDEAAPVAVGRNDPCPCQSGRKYKKCHGSVVH